MVLRWYYDGAAPCNMTSAAPVSSQRKTSAAPAVYQCSGAIIEPGLCQYQARVLPHLIPWAPKSGRQYERPSHRTSRRNGATTASDRRPGCPASSQMLAGVAEEMACRGVAGHSKCVPGPSRTFRGFPEAFQDLPRPASTSRRSLSGPCQVFKDLPAVSKGGPGPPQCVFGTTRRPTLATQFARVSMVLSK